MSVFFDYTTPVYNAYQIAKRRFMLQDGAATTDTESDGTADDLFLDDVYPAWTSNTLATPSDEQIFYAVINPGHTGTTFAIEYDFAAPWTGYVPDSFKIQIKPSGGAWATIATEASPGTSTWGVYTTPVLLPAEVQILVTDAAGSVVLQLGGAVGSFYVRCVGTL